MLTVEDVKKLLAVAAGKDWRSVRDHAISDEGVQQTLKPVGAEAGIEVAPHRLRHTTSHVLRANGMGDAVLDRSELLRRDSLFGQPRLKVPLDGESLS